MGRTACSCGHSVSRRRRELLPHCCSQSPAWTSVPCFSTAASASRSGRGSTRSGSARLRRACALLFEPRGLLLAAGLLAPLALGLLLGECCLTEGGATRGRACRAPSSPPARAARRCPAGRRSEARRCPRAAARRAGAGRRRARPRASGRASARRARLLVQLLLGLRAARVVDGHLALLVGGRRLLDAEPVRPGGRLAVLEQHERAEQLDGVGVELRLPPRERRAEVEVARPRRRRASSYWRCRSWRRASFSASSSGRRTALVSRRLLPLAPRRCACAAIFCTSRSASHSGSVT